MKLIRAPYMMAGQHVPPLVVGAEQVRRRARPA